jgi:hypothetical protein
VRLCLAQTGVWMTDLGQLPAHKLQRLPAEFTPEEIERWTTLTLTAHGLLRHLTPLVQMSETPPRWTGPSVPLGYNRPEWPALVP